MRYATLIVMPDLIRHPEFKETLWIPADLVPDSRSGSLNKSKENPTLGTFVGVFTPTILGVIMYLPLELATPHPELCKVGPGRLIFYFGH